MTIFTSLKADRAATIGVIRSGAVHLGNNLLGAKAKVGLDVNAVVTQIPNIVGKLLPKRGGGSALLIRAH
ncbi:hypothetical protein Z949_1133 [Sulfitobacter guttiformis KCTC 32187]|nr:hypothetical protein Z949_1133 [Sulfitobacter guttiformis KCTC 32187]